ncbi:hypothetical protein HDU98_001174 [Podochytrium sp. JEL0797]|nr:hypothetical protein HDU98_001174 [Podochytrium sp. JEL0797]
MNTFAVSQTDSPLHKLKQPNLLSTQTLWPDSQMDLFAGDTSSSAESQSGNEETQSESDELDDTVDEINSSYVGVKGNKPLHENSTKADGEGIENSDKMLREAAGSDNCDVFSYIKLLHTSAFLRVEFLAFLIGDSTSPLVLTLFVCLVGWRLWLVHFGASKVSHSKSDVIFK